MQLIKIYFLVDILSALLIQFFVLYLVNRDTLPIGRQGFLVLNSMLTVIFFALGLILLHLLINKLLQNNLSYSFKEAYKQLASKHDEYNKQKITRIKRLLNAFVNTIATYNVLFILPLVYLIQRFFFYNSLQSIYEYLYSGSLSSFADPHLYIFMALQLLHVLILLYWVYNKTQKFIALGFKEMVEEKYNSEEAKKYPAYSRFLLYAFPIAVLLLWIFIHPLSLLLIRILH